MALQEAQRLERTARRVTFGKPKRADIRAAVRDLTLTAIRSRVLTLPHLASVAAAIEHGIQPAPASLKSSAPTARRALEGLREGMAQALRALDLASTEYVAVGGRLSDTELEAWLVAIDALPEIADAEIHRLLGSLKKTLHAAEGSEVAEGTYVLGLLASGTLLGLLKGSDP
jgi:hypothetical protein